MVGLPARRLQVGFLIDRGISQRRACRLIGVARSALKYVSITGLASPAQDDRSGLD